MINLCKRDISLLSLTGVVLEGQLRNQIRSKMKIPKCRMLQPSQLWARVEQP